MAHAYVVGTLMLGCGMEQPVFAVFSESAPTAPQPSIQWVHLQTEAEDYDLAAYKAERLLVSDARFVEMPMPQSRYVRKRWRLATRAEFKRLMVLRNVETFTTCGQCDRGVVVVDGKSSVCQCRSAGSYTVGMLCTICGWAHHMDPMDRERENKASNGTPGCCDEPVEYLCVDLDNVQKEERCSSPRKG